MLGAKSLVTHFLMGHIIGCTIVIMEIVIKIWPRTYAVGTLVGQRTLHRRAASAVCVWRGTTCRSGRSGREVANSDI